MIWDGGHFYPFSRPLCSHLMVYDRVLYIAITVVWYRGPYIAIWSMIEADNTAIIAVLGPRPLCRHCSALWSRLLYNHYNGPGSRLLCRCYNVLGWRHLNRHYKELGSRPLYSVCSGLWSKALCCHHSGPGLFLPHDGLLWWPLYSHNYGLGRRHLICFIMLLFQGHYCNCNGLGSGPLYSHYNDLGSGPVYSHYNGLISRPYIHLIMFCDVGPYKSIIMVQEAPT
jgi:hypothetical protein